LPCLKAMMCATSMDRHTSILLCAMGDNVSDDVVVFHSKMQNHKSKTLACSADDLQQGSDA
jgi:hypothetical protein